MDALVAPSFPPGSITVSLPGERSLETLSFELSWPFRSTGERFVPVALPFGDPPGRLLHPGEAVDGTPFVVRRLLGQGGMGEVYEVEQGTDGPRRALKVLHHRHQRRVDLMARMEREARILARFIHPNLVRVFETGNLADGRPFLVMELLDGCDLRAELTRTGAMPEQRALSLAAQALDGLAAAHAAGVVHRDVKLENLFLCADGTLKVLDFGLATALGAEAALTLPGVCFGTPRTMAPEQCALEAVDPRADLYAVGLALFELCVGRGPFDELAGQHDAIRFAHCNRTPPRPGALASRPIAARVEALILKALAKAPGDRFPSALAMARALRAVTPIAEPAPPRSGPSPRWRHLGPALLAAVSVMLFALGVAFGRALPDRPAPGASGPMEAPIAPFRR